MNIFFLSFDPEECAKMHCNKHVIKLLLEACQILCSVHHLTDPEYERYEPPYKLTHKNHPCNVWARESITNYSWLCDLGLELCKEYTYRYGKIHKSQPILEELAEIFPDIPDIGFTTPAQAMPDCYRDSDDVVTAYRTYYFFEKNDLLCWEGRVGSRDTPIWVTDFEKMSE